MVCIDCGEQTGRAAQAKRCWVCAKAHKKAYQQAYNQTPEYKAYQKAADKVRNQTPERKAADKARYQTPERKVYANAYQKARRGAAQLRLA